MARHKAVAEAIQTVPTEETTMQEPAAATAVALPPQDEPAARQWRASPFPLQSVNIAAFSALSGVSQGLRPIQYWACY